MKNTRTLFISVIWTFVLYSCGQSSEKKDAPNETTGTEIPVTDTKGNVAESTAAMVTPDKPENAAGTNTAPSGQARGLTTEPASTNKDILVNIDKYLVSSVQLTPTPGGGYTQGLITVTNTLPAAGFQKALLEVATLKEDGSLLKTDYYTVINIEPGGGSKVVKLPDSKTGSKISTHILKVKSNELTDGEFVLTGNQ